jgi:hypothetical protein
MSSQTKSKLPSPAAKLNVKELMFSYDSIEHNMSHVLGRVLTIGRLFT